MGAKSHCSCGTLLVCLFSSASPIPHSPLPPSPLVLPHIRACMRPHFYSQSASLSRCGVAAIATTRSANHPVQEAKHLTNSSTRLLQHTRTRRSGHERFGHMTHVYYKYAIAAIIVFDLGRPATFESVVKVSQHTVFCLFLLPCTTLTTHVRVCATPCVVMHIS